MSFTRLPEIVSPEDGFKNARQLDTVLLLRGPGHNMMNERKEGASQESLTPMQKLEENVAKLAESKGLKLVVAQSNVEGFLINHIHAARQYGAIIFSPGALCHYSYAIYDALLQTKTPWIEVHVKNMFAAESFRKSILAPLCSGTIIGCGALGYEMALLQAKSLIDEQTQS